MSLLSELLPSGGGAGGVVEAVASGALSNGDMVVVNSDGTVSVVEPTVTTYTENLPDSGEYVYNTGSSYYNWISFDPFNANKFVIAYRDSSSGNYGKAVIGTISGSAISFGSTYTFNSGATSYLSAAFDPNNENKLVVAYRDGGYSNYGIAVVGTVSGTSISFGSEAVFNTGTTESPRISFDPNSSGKFVVTYLDDSNGMYGTACVGDISGTSITFGSEYVYNSASTNYHSVEFVPNGNGTFVAAFSDYGFGGGYGRAVVGTVSGTSITFGSEYTYNAASTEGGPKISFDPVNQDNFALGYSSTYGYVKIGTVSGTTLSFGSAYQFNSGNTQYSCVSFEPNGANKIIVTYTDASDNYYAKVVVGSVSGTAISFGSEITMNAGDSDNSFSAFDPSSSGKFVYTYKDAGNSNYGTAILGQIAASSTTYNLTTDNFIGISDADYADGATATIQVAGATDDAQSGLTAGTKYYVQTDGTLSPTAGDPSVVAGVALSSTELLLTGE